MRLEYFEYLIEIDHYKNMRVASEQLHMTPQALSICVKNMEQEVGFPIFIRKPKGVELTPEGGRLLECAERILEDYRSTLQEIRRDQEQHRERQKLIIYITPIMSVCIGRELVEYSRKRYPYVTTHIINDVPENILSMIKECNEQEEIIGVLTATEDGHSLIEALSDDLEFHLGPREELVLAVAKHSDLARQKEVAISQLEGQTLIHCTSQKIEVTPSEEVFASVKEKMGHIHCNSISLWGKLIGEGAGAGPIIKRALNQAYSDGDLDKNYITFVSIEGKPALRAACIHRREADPFVKEFANSIVEF